MLREGGRVSEWCSTLPRVPRTHLSIDRWHGPTAEELVARGEGLGVPQGVSKFGNVDHCVGVFDVGKQQRDDSHSTIP